jgi:hypothetical protein
MFKTLNGQYNSFIFSIYRNIVLCTYKILFILFIAINLRKIISNKNIFFFKNKKYFIGNGFGHYCWTSFYLRAQNYEKILIFDFYNHYNQNIYKLFNLETVKFNFSKKLFFKLGKKNEKQFFNFCIKTVSYFNKNLINSIDDLYFFNLNQKKFFFQEYNKLNYFRRNYFLRLILSKYSMWNNYIFKEKKSLNINKFLNLEFIEKLNKKFKINFDPNKKNIVFYHRYKNVSAQYISRKGLKDSKSGSNSMMYYENLFKYFNKNNYNVSIVGDFSIKDLDFIQKKYHFNVCKNKDEQNDFFIHTINNSEYFIGESGGAADLPLFLKKKILLFNYSTVGEIFPNSIIYPKSYKKNIEGKTFFMNIEEINEYMISDNKLKQQLNCNLDLVSIDRLINIVEVFLNNYDKLKISDNKIELCREMENYNCYFVNQWLKDHN